MKKFQTKKNNTLVAQDIIFLHSNDKKRMTRTTGLGTQ